VFDRSSRARSGNSSPLTDGSASIWVGDEERLRRLGIRPMVKLIDWEVVAVDVRTDGMLSTPRAPFLDCLPGIGCGLKR
jgi:acetyl-CoA C-acetyltransferase